MNYLTLLFGLLMDVFTFSSSVHRVTVRDLCNNQVYKDPDNNYISLVMEVEYGEDHVIGEYGVHIQHNTLYLTLPYKFRDCREFTFSLDTSSSFDSVRDMLWDAFDTSIHVVEDNQTYECTVNWEDDLEYGRGDETLYVMCNKCIRKTEYNKAQVVHKFRKSSQPCPNIHTEQ